MAAKSVGSEAESYVKCEIKRCGRVMYFHIIVVFFRNSAVFYRNILSKCFEM